MKKRYASSMSEVKDEAELWTAVDAYLADHLMEKDEVLEEALRDSEAAGLPAIQVTALQGKNAADVCANGGRAAHS